MVYFPRFSLINLILSYNISFIILIIGYYYERTIIIIIRSYNRMSCHIDPIYHEFLWYYGIDVGNIWVIVIMK